MGQRLQSFHNNKLPELSLEGIQGSGTAVKSEVIMTAFGQQDGRKVTGDAQGKGFIRSEKGIALVMVLILSAVALAIMAGLVYMLTAGTQVSGAQKRYRTALEAGIGGRDITYQVLASRGDPGIPSINFLLNPNIGGCLTTKLNNPTNGWGACNSSLAINPAVDNTSYDMTFTLPGANATYTVYSKIVDTVEGNSGGDIGLTKGGVVNTNSGEVSMVSIPYLYTIEIQAENAANPAERAKLSVLYQY